MTINMDKFRRALKKAKGSVEEESLKEVRKVALRVHQSVVLATPVDTGRARNNWLPNLNAPLSTPNVNAEGQGLNILAKGKAVVATAKFGDVIHFTNNLSYIGVLNDGHSAQAPSGFIQKAVQAARAGGL
jgi:hypothetical protein